MKHLKLFFACALMLLFGFGNVWATEETASFSYTDLSGQGTSGSGSAFTGATDGDITMGGSGYGAAAHVKIYAGGTLTFTPLNGVTIKGIELTAVSADKAKTWSSSPTGVSVSGSTISWSGTSTSIVTLTNTASAQAQITAMVVTYETSGGSDKCATPSISPAACSFYGSQEVTITCATADAAIYYTTDNTDPSKTNGTLYPGSAITVSDANTTVKAIAVKDGLDDSDVASVEYTYAGPAVTSYDIDFEATVSAYVNWTFTNAEIAANGANANINAHAGTHYGTTGGKSTASIQTKTKIAAPGSLTCYVSKQSDNTTSSTWYIQVSSDGSAWTDVESQSATSMTKGNWVEFTADLSAYTNVYVRLYYSGGTAIRNVDDISLEMASAVKKPTITGTTPFIGSTEVTLECTTTGATIYYTTDGTDPKTSGTKLTYSDPFNLTATTTVRAIAELSGDWSAEATSKTFTEIIPVTVASALGATSGDNVYVTGTITSITEVNTGYKNATYVISDVVAGVPQNEMIVYRGKYVKGADFTSTDQIHVGDVVVVSGSITVFSEKNQLAQNNQIETIAAPAVAAPIFTPNGGGFVVSTNVEITCATGSSTIYYTIDGSNPTKSSTEYTDAIPLSATTTIKAIAYVGDESSLVVTKTFTLTDPKTVEEAYDELTSADIENVAVEGIVYDVSVSAGNATYWISDNGSAGEKVIEVYNGKGLNGVDVTTGDIRNGDKVIVFGTLTIYDTGSGTIKEFKSGSRLLSLTRKTVESVAVTGTPSKTSYKTGDAFDPAGLTVTVTYNDASSAPVDVASCTWEKDPATFTVAGTGKTVSVKATYDEVQSPAFLVEGLTVTEVPTFNNENYEWQLVTSDAQLVAGKYYVIGSAGQNKTATKTITSGHLTEVATTISDGVIAYDALGTNTAIFQLGGSTGAWTLTEVSADNVLGTTGNKNVSWDAGTQVWAISIAEGGNATIGGDSRILHNVNSNFFNTYNSATNASMLLPQLYVWTLKTYKLRYDANGGEDAPATQAADGEGKATVTTAIPTAPTDKIFDRWNTQDDGNGTDKAAGDEIDLSTADVTLYAIWRDPVDNITISYDANGGEGSIDADADQVEGTQYTIKANAFTREGYSFAGWKAYDALDNELTITSNKITVPSTNVTIKAQWGEITVTDFVLVTDVNQLKDGDKVYIVAAGYDRAMGTQNTNYRNEVEIGKVGDFLSVSGIAPVEFTLGKNGDYFTFYDGAGYLYASSSSSNYIDTEADLDANNNGLWDITIDGEGATSIVAKGSNTRNILQYNSNNPRFSCYGNTGQKPVVLYKKANYTRAATEGRYGTICLPNGGIMHGAEIYEIAYYGGASQKIFMDEIPSGEMVAGTPYIFLPKEGTTKLAVVYTDAANADAGSHNGLIGSYTKEPIVANAGNYILLNNQYCPVEPTVDPVYVGANKAYIKLGDITPVASALKPGAKRVGLGVAAPQTPTGVDNLNASETPIKVMINGQMYIIRGEKMYNANGQLVK